MTRSRALVVVLLSLLLVGAAGCGAGTGSASSTTLRIWYSTDDPVERTWSQELATQFEATHPKVDVRLSDFSFEDLNTKLQLALSSGHPPDLAYVTPRGPGIPAYVGAHKLKDLDAAAASHGWAGKLRSGLLDQYNRPFGYYGAPGGHVMAVPMSVAAVGLLVNQRLLRKLHLSVPRSLSEFETALARARAAGYTPIGIGNADGWVGDDWYLTLVNALVHPRSLESEQRLSPGFSFNRPPYLAAAATLQRWANANYLTRDFGGLDAQEGIDVFFDGKTLFQLISSSQNSQILSEQRKTHLPIGVYAFPATYGGGVVPVSGYLGWVVPARSQHPQQAIAFIDSLLTPSTNRLLLSHGMLPATRGASAAAVRPRWVAQYLTALDTAQPGVYLDAAPVANLNATMEANVQLLLQQYEPPSFLVRSLQESYASHGKHGSTARIDGEF